MCEAEHAAEAEHLYRGPDFDDGQRWGGEGAGRMGKMLRELMCTGRRPHPIKGGILVGSGGSLCVV